MKIDLVIVGSVAVSEKGDYFLQIFLKNFVIIEHLKAANLYKCAGLLCQGCNCNKIS